VVKFPESGLLRTSTPLRAEGAATVEYYFYSGANDQVMPKERRHGWASSRFVYTESGQPIDMDFVTFFIGTDQDYAKHQTELKLRKISDYKYIPETKDFMPPVGNVANQ
jgi:hypothetical protein